MSKNNKLLLVGDSKIGKSTLLLSLTKTIRRKCSGYITRRVIDSQGTLVGFDICSYNDNDIAVNVPLGKNNDMFMYKQGDRFFVDMNVMTEFYQDMPLSGKVIVLDEIGGVELSSPYICQTITDIFSSNATVIAVYKGKRNLAKVCSQAVVTLSGQEMFDNLSQLATVVELTDSNIVETTKTIKELLEKY